MGSGSLVKTQTADGLELKGYFSDMKSAVAVLHFYGTAGDFYTHEFIDTELQALIQKNISFLTANNRGHDVFADIRKTDSGKTGWTQIGGAYEKFEDCLLDYAAWIDFLHTQGVQKIILQGHSLGPNKSVYYQYIKKDPRIIGQILLSPCNDAGLMKSILGDDKYWQTNEMIGQMVKTGKDRELLPQELSPICPMSAIAYYGYLTEQGNGNTFPYHNPDSEKWQMLSAIQEPVLAVFGADDIYIKPDVNQASALIKTKLPEAHVENVAGANHSYLGKEKELTAVIVEWLMKKFSV